MLYSEPQLYHPTQEEFKSERLHWQSDEAIGLDQGVGKIVPSLEAQGQHLDQLPDSLFLFPGFSLARSRAVRNEVDPSWSERAAGDGLIWFVGKPRDPQNHWRMEAIKQINGIHSDSEYVEISTFDYRETIRRLEEKYQERWRDNNITIGNLGSKLQTLGIALFCHSRRDVRAVNVVPKKYNAARYSAGFGARWKIEFGNTQKLSETLQSVGQIIFQ